MIKLNKGISLVSLVITIAVMLIITSITVSVSYNRFEINNLNKLKNDLELLEDKVSNYYLKYNVIPVLRKKDDNTIIKYDETTLNFNKDVRDNGNYYIIDLEAMDGISLNYGKEGFENPNTSDDVYIINEKSHQIYYVRGIELDGKLYHSILDNNEISVTNDIIPPTKPEIKMVSGETNEQGVYTSAVSIEFVSGKDNGSGVEKTTYSINDEPEELTSTLPNNTLTLTDNGTYNIKARSYDIANNISDKTEIDITIKDTSKFFITKWNITLGETEGSETYSTVVLPVNKVSTYDATIDWGDGTSTLLQHNPNGETLTDAELKEKVTHTYTLEENDNSEKTISIEGIYTDFRIATSTSTPTKLKLTQIEQWGNTELKDINFKGCTNLTGMIPKNDLIELKASDYCFDGTGIIGLEEGFHFSGGTNWRFLFAGCTKLTSIPDSFKIVDGVTQINNMFQSCTSLETLPDNFSIPFGIKYVDAMFHKCTSLKELPDGCILPNSLSGGATYFLAECTNLKTLPDGFTIPKGATSLAYMFKFSGIESLPDNFSIPESYTGTVNHMFYGCDNLQTIPEDFVIPKGVTNITCLFRGDKKIKGSIKILGNPDTYATCFANTAIESGGTLTVNYSRNCTNIDAIIATGNSNYIIKAEQPID